MSKPSQNLNILDIFNEDKLVKVCAPMVRYSKLQFRNLVKLYNCNLAFTPMILANSFCESEKARRNEFTTNFLDVPLITQFAAKSVPDFIGAAYLCSPYCNGVDLNCGCPQKWARDLELGCVMLKKPELIYDIVRQCRNRISKPFSISVKIRLLNDIDHTVNFCKQLEMCGVSFLSVHARTSNRSSGDINKNALRLIKQNCNIPIIGNGGLMCLEDCISLQKETNCDGFMVANGLLTNPTLFSGLTITSLSCIQNWLNICYNSTLTVETYEKELKNPKFTIREKPLNLTFQCFHHHLVFMMEKILPKKKKQIFNNLKTFKDVLDFIELHFKIKPELYDPEHFLKIVPSNVDFLGRDEVYRSLKLLDNCHEDNKEFLYKYEENAGKYFKTKVSSDSSIESNTEWDLSYIFFEND